MSFVAILKVYYVGYFDEQHVFEADTLEDCVEQVSNFESTKTEAYTFKVVYYQSL